MVNPCFQVGWSWIIEEKTKQGAVVYLLKVSEEIVTFKAVLNYWQSCKKKKKSWSHFLVLKLPSRLNVPGFGLQLVIVIQSNLHDMLRVGVVNLQERLSSIKH